MIVATAFGWALLALPGVMRLKLSRLQPAVWTRLAAGCLAVGAGLVGIGLLTMAVPTLLERIGAHHLAALCQRLLHDFLGGGHLGGLIAAFTLAFVTYRAYSSVRRLRGAREGVRVESWVGEHRRFTDHDVVVIPTDALVAITPGGRSTQVIVSSGLIELLDDDEFALVLKHEVSHLRRRHDRWVVLATVLEAALGWLPLVGSSAAVLRLGVERWADEDATGDDPAARRILYKALLAASGVRPNPGVASFSGFGGLEMLNDRLEALSTNRTGIRNHRWYPGLIAITPLAAAAWLGSVAALAVSVTSNGICFT